jgi:hypothetical protein
MDICNTTKLVCMYCNPICEHRVDFYADKEKVEPWSYGCQNGKVQIWFDKATRYIEIGEKDINCMKDWVDMDLGKYRPRV